MDHLQHAALSRAHTALTVAMNGATESSITNKAAAFVEGALTVMRAGRADAAEGHLSRHANPLVSKASAEIVDGRWGEGAAAELAASYIESHAGGSLLDQIARYAAVIPGNLNYALAASGFTANVVAEGFPIAVKNAGITVADADPIKAAAITVLTQELARAAGTRIFETELTSSVLGATNAAVISSLTDTSSTIVAGTGDPVADLRTALQAAPSSAGYVVAASPGTVAALALSDANKSGLGISGGELVPGVSIVPVTGIAGITVIPASLLALRDYGLVLRSAGHASVDFRDSPTAPAELVSLFTTNCLGLMATRTFLLTAAPDANLVIVQESP
ncbi:hypothetical protein [Pseudoxanthomonas koreensis]|uniref:hypothetical protein n=1 Tax=Pseudoxanthomonas koreensis TaxID=266061 RepID=UPI0013918771|nr:hypothetical protein [Pseudoxanthomonas koreensis]KAF1691852.1 hypothetical protein CSC64_08025 [Pseudoxanthomonas koreensis]